MWHPATVTVAATAEPVSLDEVKASARVDSDYDDIKLRMLVSGTRAFTEKYSATRLATQTVSVECDSFCDMVRFPEAPAQSIASITYIDTSGATQTLPTTVYEFFPDGLEPTIVLKYGQSWPAIRPGSRITVVAVVGYSIVPDDVKSALVLFIAAGFDASGNNPASEWTAFDSLLCNHRRNP